jgi:hypothetical protein
MPIDTTEARQAFWDAYLEEAISSVSAQTRANMDKCADAMDTLLWEANYPRYSQGVLVNPLTDNQREAARLCYDTWRYLLHSVDGLGA